MVSKSGMQARVGTDRKTLPEFESATCLPEGDRDTLDCGHSTERKTGRFLVDPCRPKTVFLTQLCLSQGAGVSIILPTLPRKPRFCFPNDPGTQPSLLERLSHAASECLKIDLHFRISQEH